MQGLLVRVLARVPLDNLIFHLGGASLFPTLRSFYEVPGSKPSNQGESRDVTCIKSGTQKESGTLEAQREKLKKKIFVNSSRFNRRQDAKFGETSIILIVE